MRKNQYSREGKSTCLSAMRREHAYGEGENYFL